jgi:hypothetical protein
LYSRKPDAIVKLDNFATLSTAAAACHKKESQLNFDQYNIKVSVFALLVDRHKKKCSFFKTRGFFVLK